MTFSTWIRHLKAALQIARGRGPRQKRAKETRRAARPSLEALEDRLVLSATLGVDHPDIVVSGGSVAANTGTWSGSGTLTASVGSLTQNSNGTWSWSETTDANAKAQSQLITITATDAQGGKSQTSFLVDSGNILTVTNTADSGAGSLRQAITDAGNEGGGVITFNIPTSDSGYNSSTGTFTIKPGSDLPSLGANTVIDGYSQANATLNTASVGDNAHLMIELDGSQGGAGIRMEGANTTVTGLDIHGFKGDAIGIGVDGATVEGNFIGTNAAGTSAIGNYNGVDISAAAQIGGTNAAQRNVISGNTNLGIQVATPSGVQPSEVVIQGNYIGTNSAGDAAVANGSGIMLNNSINNNSGATIGGAAAGAGNVISGNTNDGILIQAGNGSVIQGNVIGTDAAEGQKLSNSEGIKIVGTSSNNTIGGAAAGAGNVIAGNTDNGVQFANFQASNVMSGNVVQGNFIGTNAALADGLGNGAFGVRFENANPAGGYNLLGGTAPGDGNVIADNSSWGVGLVTPGLSVLGDSISANGGGIYLSSQAAPALTSATNSAAGATVTGTLASTPNTTYRIEFFASQSPDSYGLGEGQTYLGSALVSTDANGNATFTASGLNAFPTGQGYLTATATVATPNGSGGTTYGDTSGFSHYKVVAQTALTSSASSSTYGQQVTFTTTVSPNAAGLPAPTGSVDFVDTTTNTDLGKVALSNGSASLTLSSLTAGNHVISAVYSGDSTFLTSNNTFTQAVAQAQPVFSLTAPPTAISGTSTTQISGSIAAGTLVPTGSVTVTVNGVSQSATINPDGSFSVVMSNSTLGTGRYTINYSYAGDNNFTAASASATMDVTNGVLALFNQSKAKNAGSAIPVQVELVNSSGQDLTSGATITAVGMAATTDTTDTVGSIDPSKVGTLQSVQSANNANPGNVFRIQGGSEPFAMYNLQTPSNLAAGTYRLYFSVSNDPLLHWVTFTIS